METLSFTLGVLSVIIVAFVAVLVWGIVKVVKQQKQIKGLNQHIEETNQAIWRVREDDQRSQYDKERSLDMHLNERFREIEKEIANVYSRTDQTEIEIYRQINDQITDAVTQSKSYTDSRIDKLIDAYFEFKDINKKKQIIKG